MLKASENIIGVVHQTPNFNTKKKTRKPKGINRANCSTNTCLQLLQGTTKSRANVRQYPFIANSNSEQIIQIEEPKTEVHLRLHFKLQMNVDGK